MEDENEGDQHADAPLQVRRNFRKRAASQQEWRRRFQKLGAEERKREVRNPREKKRVRERERGGGTMETNLGHGFTREPINGPQAPEPRLVVLTPGTSIDVT